jgi:hypothetical protein
VREALKERSVEQSLFEFAEPSESESLEATGV